MMSKIFHYLKLQKKNYLMFDHDSINELTEIFEKAKVTTSSERNNKQQ